MTDFITVQGFEEIWRPVGSRRVRPETVLKAPPTGAIVRARLARITRRAPEVMVKVTGRVRSVGHLKAHLGYISRHGRLEVEGRDGVSYAGKPELRDLADDWSALHRMDRRRRASSPLSLSIVLSMPRDTDPLALRDAARAFATSMFGEQRDFAFVLHTDADHPHIHLVVPAMGADGSRLNPRKADLQAWREAFAEALRERGIEAEATPRRTRGVTRKAVRPAIRRLEDRRRAGLGPMPTTLRAAYREAGLAAAGKDASQRPWEARLAARHVRIRGLYLAQARLLRSTGQGEDAELAAALEAFVKDMPPPDSRRLALARELRAAAGRDRSADDPQTGRDRSR